MADFGVVRAENGDVDALVRLSRALFLEDAGSRDPLTDVGWPEKHGRQHFSGLVARDDAVCLLALAGQAPAGYLAGLMRPPSAVRPAGIAELQSMYVAPGYRGAGLGGELVRRFRLWAEDRGVGRISVTAYAANEGAIRFYRRAGFVSRSVTLEGAP